MLIYRGIRQTLRRNDSYVTPNVTNKYALFLTLLSPKQDQFIYQSNRGKRNSKVDKIEEICIASLVKEKATSEEETLDVACGNDTSSKEVAGIYSFAGVGDDNSIPKKIKDQKFKET